MGNNHAGMLVPGWNEWMLASARNSVSCTRSSARSTLPLSEMANARRLGTAATIFSLSAGSTLLQRLPFPAFRVDRAGRRSDQGSARLVRHSRIAVAGRSWPEYRDPVLPVLCPFSSVSGAYPLIDPIPRSLGAYALSSSLPVHHIHPSLPRRVPRRPTRAPSRTSSQGSPTSTFNDGSRRWNFFWAGGLSVGI